MLSALVMPGLGQIAQRRWVAAAFYGVGFLVAFFSVLFFSGRILLAYYAFGLSMNLDAEAPCPKPDAVCAVVSLGVAIVIYLAGLLDTWAAYRRLVSKWAEAGREAALLRIAGTSSAGSSRAG